MDKEELFSEFHRILKEKGQEKNCFEVSMKIKRAVFSISRQQSLIK